VGGKSADKVNARARGDERLDTGNRLTSLTSYGAAIPPLHSYTYGYDAHNNRNSITEDATTTNFTYDAYNQLLTTGAIRM